jgi:hypothetical protein
MMMMTMIMMMEAAGSSENLNTVPVFCKKQLSATLSYIQLSNFYKIGVIWGSGGMAPFIVNVNTSLE